MTVGHTVKFTTDAGITDASLVRLGTVSHTVNTDQRRIPLQISPATGAQGGRVAYKAHLPADAGVALPGYYMLFVLNSAGVPSKAATVKIELPDSGEESVSYESQQEQDGEEDEEEQEQDCEMGKDTQSMVGVVVQATRKLLHSQRPGLVNQA